MSVKVKHHYFTNLTAIRFYLATYGVFGHTNDLLSILGVKNYQHKHILFYTNIGAVFLTAFFVISGFLITHILIEEKHATNDVVLKKFFLNRIFRIWPPYYLVLFIQWFVIAHTPVKEISDLFYAFTYSKSTLTPIMMNHGVYFFLSLIMLPHLSLTISVVLDNWTIVAGHLWSTGIEEFFYFIWAPVMRKSKDIVKSIRNSILFYYIISIIAFTGLMIGYWILKSKTVISIFHFIMFFLYLTRLSCMFIGAFAAYIFFYKKDWIAKNVTTKRAIICGIGAILVIVSKVPIPLVTQELFSVLLSFLILYFVKDNKRIPILDNTVFNYLGKISYGIYLYHVSIIFVVIYFCKKYNFFVVPVIYIIILSLTILAAALSYEYYEKQLQKLKVKYFMKK